MSLSLAQSSFLLSSLVASPPHRQDGRSLESYRPVQLHPPIEAGYVLVDLGSTSISAHASCQAVKSTASADSSNEEDDEFDGSASEEGEGAGLWNVNIATAANVVPPVSNGGNSSKTGCVELDNQLEHLTHLIKRHLTSVVPVDQFVILSNGNTDAVSHTEKLRGATYWSVHIDVTIESMSGGNLWDAIWAAMFASLYRVRVPRTREVAYLPPGGSDGDDATSGDVAELGIKSLKAQQKRRAVDFELVDAGDDGREIEGCERLGGGVTVGMLPNQTHLADATLEEELSLPSSRRLFVVASSSSSIHTTHLVPSLLNLTAGEGQVPSHVVDTATGLTVPSDESIRFPKPEGEVANWEENGTGWGIPLYPRVRVAAELGARWAAELAGVLRRTLEQERKDIA